jgi:hypothetical protein
VVVSSSPSGKLTKTSFSFSMSSTMTVMLNFSEWQKSPSVMVCLMVFLVMRVLWQNFGDCQRVFSANLNKVQSFFAHDSGSCFGFKKEKATVFALTFEGSHVGDSSNRKGFGCGLQLFEDFFLFHGLIIHKTDQKKRIIFTFYAFCL